MLKFFQGERLDVKHALKLFIFYLFLPTVFPMSMQAVRMIYTNTGGAILALTVNGVHKLWKWEKNEHNLTGKVFIHIKGCILFHLVICRPPTYKWFLFARQLVLYHHNYGSLEVEY